jgi:hypothetical protein
MGLARLLIKHGFATSPFDSWTAESEAQLPQWHVPPTFLATLLGIPTGADSNVVPVPKSHVVFGRPGDGKTALRIVLERDILARAPNALLLRYVDLTPVLAVSPQPTLASHVDEILKLGAIGLIGRWFEFPSIYQDLSAPVKQDLAWLVEAYYDRLPPQVKDQYAQLTVLGPRASALIKQGVHAAVEAYNATIAVLRLEQIKPTTWASAVRGSPPQDTPFLRLQKFWGVAAALGVPSIWVLVDKIDEAPGVQTADAIFKAVSYILLTQSLLEFSVDTKQVLCLKVFLTRPGEVQPQLKSAGFRTDRVKTEEIRWARKDLNDALTKRLSHFSGRTVLHFDAICASQAQGTHDKLLDKCDLRPRTLFRMAHEILAEFDLTSDATADKLDQQSIERGIDRGLKAVVG